jgi:hypothetical protein
MATYTVENSFSADTTAIASQVNQNFTDVLEALNSFDAANLTGTISLARISNLTSTQMSSAFFKDEDDMSSNSATAVSSQQALKAYVDDQVLELGAYTRQDDDSNNMVKAHAYRANQDGFVTAVMDSSGVNQSILGYVHTTDDPAGVGIAMGFQTAYATGIGLSIMFPVRSGQYFEITDNSGNEPVIYWHPVGTLSEPTDQD